MKLLKVLGIVVAVVIVLLAATAVTLKIMYPPEKIKALVLPQVEKAVGRTVQVDHVALSLYPFLGLKIRGLVIANTAREGFSKDAFVKLDEFLLKVRLLALLEKKLDIDQIVLRRPHILVETDRAGAFNFDDLAFMAKDTTRKAAAVPAAGMPMLPIPLTLRTFTIEQGSVSYVDRKGRMKVELGEINQQVNVSIDKQLRDVKTTGKLTISGISFQSKDVPKPVSGVVVTVTHDIGMNVIDGVVNIKEVRASLQKIYVTLSGTVKDVNTAAPQIDLALKTDKIAIADLVAEIPSSLAPDIAKVKASGSAEVSLSATGAVGTPALPHVKGMLKLADVVVHYTDLPQSITGLNADIAFTENSLTVDPFAMNLGNNPIHIKALIENFAKPRVDALVDAVVNLDDMKNVIKLDPGSSVGGRIEAKVAAKGLVDPADPTKLDVKGSVKLQNVTTATTALTKPVTYNGTVDFTSRKISPKIAVKIGASSANLTADLVDYLSLALRDSTKHYPRPKVTFAMTSPLFNTNEFLPQPPAGAAAKEPQAAAPSSLLLPAPLPGIDMSGTISTGRLVYQNFDLSNVSMKVTSVSDVMDIDVKAGIFQGTMTHVVHLDAKNIRDLKVKSVMGINGVEISKMLAAVKEMIPANVPLAAEVKKLDNSLFGKITMKTDFTANGGTVDELVKTLNGSLDSRLADGKIAKGELLSSIAGAVQKFFPLNEIDFREMTMGAKIHDQRVFIDEMKVNSPLAGDWKVGGDVGFDAGLNLTLANHVTAALSKPIVQVQGQVKGAVQGALDKTGVAGLSNIVAGAGVPVDKEGRVTLLLGVVGNVAKPQVTFKGFGGENAGQPQASPQQQVRQQIQKQIEAKKEQVQAQAQQAIDQQKQRAAEEAAKQKAALDAQAAAEKARLDAEKAKAQSDLKKAAGDKLKKLF